MPFYRTPGGMSVHLNFGSGNKKAPAPCHAPRERGVICAWVSSFLCDWKLETGQTCDMPLCETHAFNIAPDKHLCPQHVEMYRAWLREQAIAY